MSSPFASNEAHLRSLYAHGFFKGVGSVCALKCISVCERRLYGFTVQGKPVDGWIRRAVENDRRPRSMCRRGSPGQRGKSDSLGARGARVVFEYSRVTDVGEVKRRLERMRKLSPGI